MNLNTNRLLLRPWRQEDADALYKYASDPAVGPACGWVPHRNREESRRIILTVLNGEHTFALVLKETQEPVGCASLFRGAVCAEQDLELGYWLGRPLWGQGLMTEAARRLVKYGFSQLECPRIWCAHAVSNARSRRIIEKLRFRQEFLREEVAPSIGERRLIYYYSRFREEERRGEG